MANLLDYLDWRGDLTLRQSPFNEVDNLFWRSCRSWISAGSSRAGAGGRRTAESGCRYIFRPVPGRGEDRHGCAGTGRHPGDAPGKMAAAPRFRDMKLSCFVDHLDVGKVEQFAALTIETGDGFFYLSFRGTDDTLAGWKEDFDLACMPEVPAQKKAVAYLTEVARQYPRQKLRLGGHSKGGNLAVYAGVFWPGRRCAAGSPRVVQRRPGLSRGSAGPAPAPPAGGADLFHCSKILSGGDAAGA